jgi:hypothetical protein
MYQLLTPFTSSDPILCLTMDLFALCCLMFPPINWVHTFFNLVQLFNHKTSHETSNHFVTFLVTWVKPMQTPTIVGWTKQVFLGCPLKHQLVQGCGF